MLKIESDGERRWIVDAQGSFVVRVRSFSEMAKSSQGDVFLVASGPSIKDFPLSKYSAHPFIAMNGSILACLEHDITPHFYLCDDEGFAHDRSSLVLLGVEQAENVALSLEALSRVHEAYPGCLKGRSVFILERVNRFIGREPLSDRAYAWSIRRDPELISGFSLFKRSPNRIGFSLNMDKGYFVARTIPYVGLQLCHQLGYSRLFLIGVDLNGKGGRFYEAGRGALGTSLDEDFEKYILPSFKWMSRRVMNNENFQVFNMSLGSRMPSSVLPKLSEAELASLLSVLRP